MVGDPAHRQRVVAGRGLADLISAIVSLAVVSVAGLLFGWRPETSIPAIIAALGLLLLLRFSLVWVGVFLGLRLKSPEATMAVQLAVWPLLFLSGIFIDTSTMPRWLGSIADANPLSATTVAVRDLFGVPIAPDQSWLTEHAPLLAVAWPVLLTVVFVPLASRAYRNLRR